MALPLSVKDIEHKLIANGFILSRVNSSHAIYKKSGNMNSISVPRHKYITPGVYHQIFKKSGINVHGDKENN